MKLLYSPASPYVRKVMITAHELGLADRFELVTGGSSPLEPNPAITAVNPVGKLPALILDDGTVLADSRVICRYLNRLGGGALYGSGAAEFPIIAREAMAEGMIDAALLVVYEGRLRPENIRFEDYVEGQRGKIRRGLDAFEARVAEMAGDPTIDKIALGAALGYFDFRGPVGEWRGGRPGLAAWYSAWAERPSMQATMPVG